MHNSSHISYLSTLYIEHFFLNKSVICLEIKVYFGCHFKGKWGFWNAYNIKLIRADIIVVENNNFLTFKKFSWLQISYQKCNVLCRIVLGLISILRGCVIFMKSFMFITKRNAIRSTLLPLTCYKSFSWGLGTFDMVTQSRTFLPINCRISPRKCAGKVNHFILL